MQFGVPVCSGCGKPADLTIHMTAEPISDAGRLKVPIAPGDRFAFSVCVLCVEKLVARHGADALALKASVS